MTKETYTITEVSQKYQINVNTLRYYERIGLLPKVPRTAGGKRYFTPTLLKWLEMVICLRHSGVAIEPLIKYRKLLEQGDKTLDAREKLLKEQLELLYKKQQNLARSIARLEHKISLYETGEIKKERSYFEEYAILADEGDSWKEFD